MDLAKINYRLLHPAYKAPSWKLETYVHLAYAGPCFLPQITRSSFLKVFIDAVVLNTQLIQQGTAGFLN